MEDTYTRYEEFGGYCPGCRKHRELCRCDSWIGPKAEEPKHYSVRHFDLGLRRTVYSGAMTRRVAESMRRDLARARRKVAQVPTVLRRLRVIQHVCSAPVDLRMPEPRLEPFDRWTEK